MLRKSAEKQSGALIRRSGTGVRLRRLMPCLLLGAVLLPLGAQAATPPPGATEPSAVTAKAGSCTPSATLFCLDQGRFRVTVDWRKEDGETGVGTGVAGATADSGLFWFFAPTNYEVMVKVLDGCGVNGRHWVFFLATTNVGFTLTVTDTQTQQVKSYVNPPGTVSPVVTDTGAFATCP